MTESAESVSPQLADTATAASAPVAAANSDQPETVNRPAGDWQPLNFGELWQHRELLYFLAWRDVKVRYKQTALGILWVIVQPLVLMLVFTIFLGGSDVGRLPYPAYVLSGLLPWLFFANAVTAAANSVVASERLVSKVYFPRLAIPLAAVLATLLDLLIAGALLAVVLMIFGVWSGANILLLPCVVGLLLLAATGFGTLFAALNVAYRDFRYLATFLIQVWLFATPSIYQPPPTVDTTVERQSESEAGTEVTTTSDPRGLAHSTGMAWLNPVNGLVSAFRACVVGGPLPWHQLVPSAVMAVAVFLCGTWYFRRVEDRFADII